MYRLRNSSQSCPPNFAKSGMALFFLVLLPGLSGLRAQGLTPSPSYPSYSTYWTYLAYALLLGGLLFFGYLWQRAKSRHKQLLNQKDETLLNQKSAAKERESLQTRYLMLENGLEEVKKQLRSKTIALVKKTKENDEKGRLLQTLKEEVDELTKQNASTKFQWRKISRILGEYEEAEENNFSVLIEELHQDFLASLNERFPDLTTYDQRLSGYLKSGLTTREMAELMNVLPSSVNVSRSRLRKKLQLAPKEDLHKFLKTIE